MYLYISNYFHAWAVLRYLQKLKKGVALAFSADFLGIFFHKITLSLLNTLSTDQISMLDLIFL